MSDYVAVRDLAVNAGRMALVVDLEQIDAALAEADRSLALGPVLDPTAFRVGVDELERQVKFLRSFRAFRAAVEELRP
jgi:hypothetical protein